MMAHQIAQVFIRGALVIWLAVTVVFFVLRMLPGSVITTGLLQSGASAESIRARLHQLGMDASPIQQYGDFLGKLLHGDLGRSVVDGQSVTQLISQRATITLPLALVASVLAVALGIVAGMSNAVDGRSPIGRLFGVFIVIFLSLPAIWTGTLTSIIITLMAVQNMRLATDMVQFWVPAVLLAAHIAAPTAQAVRASVRSVLARPHVQTARAKGLTERRVLIHHILREALLPVVHLFPLQLGFLLGGTVMVESVFSRPGIGLLLVERVLRQDYPVVQGLIILAACTYFVLGTIADLVQQFVDPRLRHAL